MAKTSSKELLDEINRKKAEKYEHSTPLRKARLKRGLTILEAAVGIGMTHTHLHQIETCSCLASPQMAERIAAFYGGDLTEMQILYPKRFMSGDAS